MKFKAVEKIQSSEDKRVFTVSLTELGQKYYTEYLDGYHNEVAERLSSISDDDAQLAARVIHEAYSILSGGKTTIG